MISNDEGESPGLLSLAEIASTEKNTASKNAAITSLLVQY